MGISIKTWLLNKLGLSENSTSASCENLHESIEEYCIRELAFNTCVSMIANAVSKCEFKTFRNKNEIKEHEYYLWNIEPNINQNSTVFLHKLIYKLYSENEALVISTKHRDGHEMLVVADSFMKPLEYPSKMQEYTNVVVGEVQYDKTFKENEVLHFKLNDNNIKPVIDALCISYNKMIAAAVSNYNWASGKHYKVHVSQIARGGEGWQKDFKDMINEQVKPFFNSDSSVLPEFDGYEYEDIGGKADANRSTRDIKALYDDIFTFTARGLSIPPVLIYGDVAGTTDAMSRWLTTCIDPLCDQIQEEINRKRYGYNEWVKGNFVKVDTSSIIHFDLFENAANIEKLIGTGAFSINDVLTAAGFSTINEPWADKHYLTLNIGTIESASKVLEKEGGE